MLRKILGIKQTSRSAARLASNFNINKLVTRAYAAESHRGEDDDDVRIDISFVENQINALLQQEENPHLADWRKLGKPTAEKVMNFVRDHIGGKMRTYKTKYPNITLEDVQKKVEEQLARPIYGIDDQFYKWVQTLGYTRAEIDQIIYAQYPTFNKENPDWDAASAAFSTTNAEIKSWKLIAEAYDSIRELGKIRKAQAQNPNAGMTIDWEYWEKKLGKESADEYKNTLERLLSSVPSFKGISFKEVMTTHFDPLFDEIKDEIIDSLPHIEAVTDELIMAGELRRRLESGEGIHIDDFLDNFYPNIRNEMDLEIENDNWDFEYQEIFKKDLDNKTPQDFITDKDAERDAIEAIYEEISDDSVQISTNPERERLLKEWLREQDRVKKLEQEVTVMKQLSESEYEAGHEEEEAEAAGEEKQEAEAEFAPLAKQELSKMFDLEPDFWDKIAAEEREARRKEREAKGSKDSEKKTA